MEKFIRSNYKVLVGILIGIIISGIGVYASSNILAVNVTYTPSDSNWNVNNTASALDNLYNYYETNKYVKQKDCVQGSFVCDDKCVGSEGLKLTDFKPSYATFYYQVLQVKEQAVYNEKISNSLVYYTTKEPLEVVNLIMKNNTLIVNNWGENFRNIQVDYVACK